MRSLISDNDIREYVRLSIGIEASLNDGNLDEAFRGIIEMTNKLIVYKSTNRDYELFVKRMCKELTISFSELMFAIRSRNALENYDSDSKDSKSIF